MFSHLHAVHNVRCISNIGFLYLFLVSNPKTKQKLKSFQIFLIHSGKGTLLYIVQLSGKLGHGSCCIALPATKCLHHNGEELDPLPVTVTEVLGHLGCGPIFFSKVKMVCLFACLCYKVVTDNLLKEKRKLNRARPGQILIQVSQTCFLLLTEKSDLVSSNGNSFKFCRYAYISD
jgi:hypothetical protein